MKNCNCHTEINTDGSGQAHRYLKALDPSYAPVDGKNIKDLLVLAKKYAAQIRFYDISASNYNNPDDAEKLSWREFFRRDMAVVIASVSLTDLDSFKKEFSEVREKLELDPHPSPDLFASLFKPILGMMTKIDHWYSVSVPENPLYKDIVLAVDSALRWEAKTIMAYKKGFNIVDPNVQLNINFDGIENIEWWGIDDPFTLDRPLYDGNTKDEKIKDAALGVEDIFYGFYNFIAQLLGSTDKYLDYAIQQYPGHQPHMALFITFLELFRIAQNQMNGLTERMLNFYYREVLKLTEKPSIPDKAHIVFELAKDVAEFHLEKGRALTAGNDSSGKEQVYKTEEDFVINQAKVKELKTVFIEKDEQDKAPADQVVHAIYARPVANSLDGFGEKFIDPNPKWPTFGTGEPERTDPKNICQAIDLVRKLSVRTDRARVGFAIASHQLLLQGGKRLIELRLGNAETFSIIQDLLSRGGKPLEFQFTGEMKWFTIDKMMVAADLIDFKNSLGTGIFPDTELNENKGFYYIDNDMFNDKPKMAICVYLPIAEPPVVAYDPELHKDFKYSTVMPVMQVRLNPVIDLNATDYNKLSATGLSLRVKVGSINADNGVYHFDGLSKLVLQTQDGIQPIGKPFDPFSPYPLEGKSFYIGSDEVFNKPVDELAINIIKTIPEKGQEANDMQDYSVKVLQHRNFIPLGKTSNGSFNQLLFAKDLTRNILLQADSKIKAGVPLKLERIPILPVTEWVPGMEKGFFKITNLISGSIELEDRQEQAPDMEIAEVYISYDSTLSDFKTFEDEFYHVYPFGNVQIFMNQVSGRTLLSKNALSGVTSPGTANNTEMEIKEEDPLIVDARELLLPQFTYLSPYEKYNSTKGGVASGIVVRATSGGPFDKLRDLIKGASRTDKKVFDLMLDASDLESKTGEGANQYSALIQEEGILLIGLENLKPLQTVSLLFQFAEGSAEDEDNKPPDIHWSYLTYNRWRPLKAENIVQDGTSGFQTTGIVKISIPADASYRNTISTDGLYWLSASVTNDSERIPQLVDVVTQATEVIFEDNENDPSHFDNAVPAGTISALVAAVPQVSKVSQPFASFDGKHKEIGREFYTRVSERLRHKHRAITPWDYEHIVLNRFPSVYKVKCITHIDPDCLCREPVSLLSASKKGAASKPIIIRFAPGKSEIDAKSRTMLKRVINEVFNNAALTIRLTGHSEHTNESAELNLKRIEWIKKQFTDAKVDGERIHPALVKNGEKNLVEIAGIRKKDVKDVVVKKDDVCCGPQVAPGHVLLIPIADLKNRNAVNPLQPKTARRILLDIESYLKKLTSPFVHVHAKNPVYEQVLVFFRVKFKPQYEIGYYIKQLNEEIVRFLTPWAFDERAEVKFGEKIYASSIINFIEEREYVDFITDFLMAICKDECCPPAAEKKIMPQPIATPAKLLLKKTADGLIDGLLNDTNGRPLSGIQVVVKDTSIEGLTNEKGNFLLKLETTDSFRLILSFRGFQIGETKDLTADDLGKELDIILTEVVRLEEVVVTGTITRRISTEEIEKLCGCSSVEYLFQDELDFPGDIVARPSTARSILVSAPRHIIVPYEAPEYVSPCDRKKNEAANRRFMDMDSLRLDVKIARFEEESLLADKNKAETRTEDKTETQTETKTRVTKTNEPVKKQPGKKPNK